MSPRGAHGHVSCCAFNFVIAGFADNVPRGTIMTVTCPTAVQSVPQSHSNVADPRHSGAGTAASKQLQRVSSIERLPPINLLQNSRILAAEDSNVNRKVTQFNACHAPLVTRASSFTSV